jgi:RimJ/RimL family protein N-acetyltransferase
MPLTDDNLLQGSLVRLAALRPEDFEEIAKSQLDTRAWRLMDTRPAAPASAKSHEEWFTEESKKENVFRFTIRSLADDSFLGFAELDGVDWPHGDTGLGIALLDPDTWGKGYGRDAMELLLRFSFAELNMHRVTLTVFEYNDRAVSLYEGLGFQREGTYRERLLRDGERYDMYLYGILRSEWEARTA